MNIGILECESLPEDISTEFGNMADIIATAFQATDATFKFHYYDVKNNALPAIGDCHAYIISGSHSSVDDPDAWIERLYQFIQVCIEQQKPLVGICFGHQLIAKALGGTVYKVPHGWSLGIAFTDIISSASWMTPPSAKLDISVGHQEQIATLPQGARILAGSDLYPNFLIQHNERTLSTQGHPEFSADLLLKVIASPSLDIPNPVKRKAKALLKMAVNDNQTLIRWMANFINQSVNGHHQ